MTRPNRERRPQDLRWALRRADQAMVAGCVALGLIAMSLYWLSHAGTEHRLMEIEPLDPRPVPFIVDVNEADWPELTQIPGIGESLARRIVERRGEIGAFRDLDELDDVQGIGPRTLERMRPYLLPIPDRETVAGP